ncbi:MAG: protease family protein [Clostridia bacterium]|nr:protease family protein [Clostridia bacterium]
MTAAGLIFIAIATWQQGPPVKFNQINGRAILIGLATAVILYLVFWVGNIVSRWLFSFAGEQIAGVYGNKAQAPAYLITLMIVFVIGPAEEIFWRGFIQGRFMEKWGEWTGLLAGAVAYTFVHIWSGNLILMLAALICGLFWGWLYKQTGSLVPGIISHVVWDVVIFILFPVA